MVMSINGILRYLQLQQDVKMLSEVSEYNCSSAVFVFEENAEFQVEVGENEGGSSPPAFCHDPLLEKPRA